MGKKHLGKFAAEPRVAHNSNKRHAVSKNTTAQSRSRRSRVAWVLALCLAATGALHAADVPSPTPTIRLRNRTSRPDPAARTTAADNQQATISAEARDGTHGLADARDRLPYLVQFSDSLSRLDRQRLRNVGATVCHAVPSRAVLLLCRPEQIPHVAALPGVRWIDAYQPADKISAALGPLGGVRALGADAPVEVVISVLSPAQTTTVAKQVERLGGRVLQAGQTKRWGVVHARASAAVLESVSQLAEVEWVEPYIPAELHNNVAVQAERMNATAAWTNRGLTGRGQIVAIADSGLDTGDPATLHPDFTNRVLAAFGVVTENYWTDNNGHGTHVAGSVLGSGAAFSNGLFRGVAYEADLVFQAIGDPGGSSSVYTPSPLEGLFEQAYTNGARIHSDSWGSNVDGDYTANARSADASVWDHPDLLIVVSAGNAGIDADEDGIIDPGSLGAPGTAKNILTVGAAESLRPPGSGGHSDSTWGDAWPADYPAEPIAGDTLSTPDDDTHQGMAAFSSRGPCADGRIKPDIVAPGTDIVSCRSHMSAAGVLWGTGSGVLAGSASNDYTFSGGTSMSTPLTAGAAALLRQYLVERLDVPRPSASLMKAFLVSGARSLSPGQYGESTHREVPSQRPNNVEGWGQVDVDGSLFPSNGARHVFWDQSRLSTGETHAYPLVVTDTNALRITLAWSDYPPAMAAAQQLVNDLDLTLVTPSGITNYPGNLGGADRTNNVEGIALAEPELGTNWLRVTGTDIPEGPQPYSLLATCAGYPATAQRVDSVWHEPLDVTTSQLVTVFATVTTNASGIDAVVTVYSVNSNAWVSLPMAFGRKLGENLLYSAELPSLQNGDLVDYYVSATAVDLSASVSKTNHVAVWSSSLCVALSGGNRWPYNTWESAFTNIQDAIDLAADGTTVLVTNGTYQGHTVVVDQTITLRGVNGAAFTIINGEGARPCLQLTASAVCEGFTLTNGYSSSDGGAATVESGWLSQCVVRNSRADNYGGGLDLSGGVVDRCTISDNVAGEYGGGMILHSGYVRNTLLVANTSASDAGGVELWGGVVSNCTVVLNQAGGAGGGIDVGDLALVINTIVVSNTAQLGGDNWYEWEPKDFAYCCTAPRAEGTGNIDVDPRFADPAARDFHLRSEYGRRLPGGGWTNDALNSPCIDMADPTSGYDREPAPNGSRANMGAYGGTEGASRSDTNHHTLVVRSAHTGVTPPVGWNILDQGSLTPCAITNALFVTSGTQYVGAGWSVLGCAATNGAQAGSGTDMVLRLTNNAILTWRWQTNVTFTAEAGAHGQVSGSSNGWTQLGSSVCVTGVPDNYFRFSIWTGGVTSAANPLCQTLSGPLYVGALFSERLATNSVPQWWLAQYGWTSQFDTAAMADTDKDGMAAWGEYVAGTVPTNPLSVLAVEEIAPLFGTHIVLTPTDGLIQTSYVHGVVGAIVSWPGVSGRLYSVESPTGASLSGFAASPGGSNLPAKPPLNTFTNVLTTNAPHPFFRIRASFPPEP